MERAKDINSILRQFKKKSKRIMNKGVFTEFFYLNKSRRVIEFLILEDNLIIENFLKEFLPDDFKEFVNLKLVNEDEEEIRTWFYNDEGLVLILEINWGFKKQEISLDIDIENFILTALNDDGSFYRKIDYNLLNDYLISFLSNQASILSQSFKLLSKKQIKN